jgi:hypothetical protein
MYTPSEIDEMNKRKAVVRKQKTVADVNAFKIVQEKFADVMSKLKQAKGSAIEDDQASKGLFRLDLDTPKTREESALAQFESALSSAPTAVPTLHAGPASLPTTPPTPFVMTHLTKSDERSIVMGCNQRCCLETKNTFPKKTASTTCPQLIAMQPCDDVSSDKLSASLRRLKRSSQVVRQTMCTCLIKCEFVLVDMPTPVPTSLTPTASPSSLPTVSPTPYPTGAPVDFANGLDALLDTDEAKATKLRDKKLYHSKHDLDGELFHEGEASDLSNVLGH